MFEKKLLLILASVSLSALIGCSSGGGGDDDLDITEIQEIEQTGEFSEDEFFASEDVDNLDEEQLVEEVPGLEEDLEVTQDELEASGDEGFEIDLAEEEQDLFEEAGLGEDDLLEESSIADNSDISDEELDGLLDEDLGEDVAFDDVESDISGDELDGEELALESEEDLFRDLEEDSDIASGETFSDTTSEQPASELLADDEIDYSLEASDNYEESAGDIISEDINVDVDYSQALAEDGSASEFGMADEAAAPKSFIPVKKMKTVPYNRNGVLVNAIYFVRQGDSLRGIADKVYGSGSAVDFTIVNPHLKPGGLRVGQKVYYNSPTRPQDRSRLLTYYEDARAPMMSYSAREGENIRAISKNLLGHPRSWMEVWATNMQIESKGSLDASTQVRYWEGAPSRPSTPVLATNQEPAKLDTGRNNQANLNIQENEPVDDMPDTFEDEVAVNEPTFEESDLEDPIVEDDFNDELAEDLASVGGVNEPAAGLDDSFDAGNKPNDSFDGEIANNNAKAPNANLNDSAQNPRNVALNNSGGGFPTKANGGIEAIMNDPAQMGIIGGALVLLLLVALIVIRRRRAGADEAIEMESFDFGGETVIDGDDMNKTQVDI